MRILAVDVGTGTQDILLFDSEHELENSVKMVMPSPTLVVADIIRDATAAGLPIVLRGVTMGGGPSHWAAIDHLRAGRAVYATPAAARTFDDDLEAVAEMGIGLVSEDEAEKVPGAIVVDMRDLWFDRIVEALERFGVEPRLEEMAVAVFDHGAAPPGCSDRVFRFEYLAERLRQRNSLVAFAYLREEIPMALTRLAAVASTAPNDLPLLAMDTAPAAVLGALEDPRVWSQRRAIVANVGNFHCLAFRFDSGRVSGLFEHHSGELTSEKLRRYVEKLAAGTISNEEIYSDMGHGALTFEQDGAGPVGPLETQASQGEMPFLAVTGPRRALLADSGLEPYLAVPHGDMMLAGCFGLLRAYAGRDTGVAEAVVARLGPSPSPVAA
jgi:uncharacterized protein (DUF1786 family)